MQQQTDGMIPPPPPPRRGWSPRLVLLSFGFTTFVLGGFLFGAQFLANWRVLMQLRTAEVQIPGGPRVPIAVPVQPTIVPAVPPGAAPTPVAAPKVVAKPEEQLPEWTNANRLNVMLLGIDQRDDEPIDGSRSDTVMVVSIDPPSKAVVMVSLPRDLWVSIPGHYNQRLNTAHVLGGPALVARTVEANFGFKIDNYARINFRGFEQIVDELGGVIIDVERTIKDDEYPTEDYGVMRLFIPPGPQLMDGKQALQYARSRHSENDFARARRQQRVLVAIRDRGLQLNILPKVPSLIGMIQGAVSTDFGVLDMIKLANLGSQIERDRVKSVVVDATLADPFVGPAGEDLLMPRRGDIQRAVARAFAEATGQTARLEVLNGTARQGVARQLADQLANAGYDIVRVDTADRSDYTDTSIVVLGDSQAAANILAQRLRLPPSAVQASPTPDSAADIRIIVGQSYIR